MPNIGKQSRNQQLKQNRLKTSSIFPPSKNHILCQIKGKNQVRMVKKNINSPA